MGGKWENAADLHLSANRIFSKQKEDFVLLVGSLDFSANIIEPHSYRLRSNINSNSIIIGCLLA
jgi:hypothetical protein